MSILFSNGTGCKTASSTSIITNQGSQKVFLGQLYANGVTMNGNYIGIVTETTANFNTFPENGIFIFLISLSSSLSSSSIMESDNQTKVYLIAVCDYYPAQVKNNPLFGDSGGYFFISSGSTT